MIWAIIAWIVYSIALIAAVTDEYTPWGVKAIIPFIAGIQVAVVYAVVHFITKYW
jgi:hypothetical protein